MVDQTSGDPQRGLLVEFYFIYGIEVWVDFLISSIGSGFITKLTFARTKIVILEI